MSTSTLTKLQVANAIALSVGELKVNSLSSLVGQQLNEAIRSAIFTVNQEAPWLPMRDLVNADSWSNEIASLTTNTAVKTFGVYFEQSLGNQKQLQWRDYASFKVLYPTYDEEGVPRYYSIEEENKYLVLPYPSASDQANVYFDIQKELTLPANDGDNFDIADRYVHMIRLKGSQIFSEHHNGAGSGQGFLQEYLQYSLRLKANNQRRPQGQVNFYRRERRGGNA